MATIEVKVPDIGDFKDVPVIEVLVKPGDTVKTEQSLVTLESDKATMDVPSPVDGVVKELKVKVGDKVSEGSVILTVEAEAAPAACATRACSKAPLAGEGAPVAATAQHRALRDGRGARPRHRRLQGHPGHRGAGQAGRHHQGRGRRSSRSNRTRRRWTCRRRPRERSQEMQGQGRRQGVARAA